MKLALLCMALVALDSFGRPVSNPALQNMWAEADLVAVIRPLATTNATDQLTSAGPKYGPRDPRNYQAMNTRCEIVLVMKTAAGLQGWATNELTLLHFRYAPNVPEFNGGRFIYFDFAPTELELTVKGGPAHPVCVDTDPTYLAFLKRGPDDRFIPVTGHYDSEPSFRMMATPTGGAVRYALKDGKLPKQAEANESVPAIRILPEDVDQESIHQSKMGPTGFVVRWTYTQEGAHKMLAFWRTHAGQAVLTQIGSFERRSTISEAEAPGWTEEGWLKWRTDKFIGVSEGDARKIVAGLKGE